MVLPNDVGGEVYRKHIELCTKLNLDNKITNEAWGNFQEISKNYTLEGDPLHWIACAIFVACWQANSNTGQNQSQNSSSSVNLKILLLNCNLSLARFFYNIKPWSNMAQVPGEFQYKISQLEKSITVSLNVFEKYQYFFKSIFIAPEPLDQEQTKQARNRKQRPSLCTSLRVFEFCWTLFITIKADTTKYKHDLVSMSHLLTAVCDWIFKNAFMADRRDLLNPDFKALPLEWSNPSFEVPQEAPCIVPYLCEDAITEVKYIKEYPLKASLQNLFERGILVGGETEDLDVMDPGVFDRNFKTLSSAYENEFLDKGQLDERILLAEFKRKLLENVQNQNNVLAPTSQRQNEAARGDSATAEFPKETVSEQDGVLCRKSQTPRESQVSTTATEGVARLNALLSGRQPPPSDELVQLFESCTRDPTERVSGIVTRLSEKFSNASKEGEVPRKVQLATKLFYKLIENILQNEKAIHSDISLIVEKDIFYECMFVCSLEIVLFSYNSCEREQFPWILNTLDVQSYNFIKVIELIIRLKDRFSRDVIKHLNMIEEMILSSEVWKSDSLIWQAINLSEQEIPKFEETALPGHLETDQNSDGSALRNILNCERKLIHSPGPSATDRFQSPVLKQTHLMIKDSTGATRMIPISVNNTEGQKSLSQPVTPTRKSPESVSVRPRRTGGLSILFRKFYNLSGERLQNLCNHLEINNVDMKKKIWTVFEELVRKNNCELMKDRDLDQLLMCAIYMICRITKTEKNFTDIMKSYRNQPQATSDIYRNVLVHSKISQEVDGVMKEIPEERGDLIGFYNTVIIQAMKKFVENFVEKGNNQNTDVLLSPLPATRRQIVSPVVKVRDNVFIKPLESPTTNVANGKVYNYYFCRSPSRDLKDINKAIRGNGVTGKRLLIEGEVEMSNAKKLANRKVQSLIEDRKNNQNIE